MPIYMLRGQGGRTPGANTLAYYPFIDDYNDHSGNGYNVTDSHATQLVTLALTGVKCLDMNASFCATNVAVTTLPYTIVFWAKAKDSGLSRAFAINWSEGGSWGGSGISAPTRGVGLLEARSGNTTNKDVKWSASSSYANTNWHLYVASWGTNRFYVYVDGNATPVTQAYWTTGPTNNGSPLRIGARQDGTPFGNGYISSVIIENKAWTAQDAADFYDTTKSYYGIS